MKTPDDLFDFTAGDSAVLFSVPHAGTRVPDGILARFRDEARGLPDTDWYVERLYDFAPAQGAGMIRANYSRYVIDLNRPPGNESLYPGQATTGLCPHIQFDGTPVYRDGREVAGKEVAGRQAAFWQPYHAAIAAELSRIKARHGFAILYDCHSILSRVPRLFEGTLPVLNLGTVNGASADASLQQAVARLMQQSGFTHAINGRFIGGHITRSFGKPDQGVHAVQMELGCDAYLADRHGYKWDAVKSARLKAVLNDIGAVLRDWRP